ncbi:hypothetical protein BC834DRAFT_227597 [Gloeopeniophorella convolvens]|nr:hypothetical protein BC834DRAFT_227597 [Gloeopeniophorella convolvens]
MPPQRDKNTTPALCLEISDALTVPQAVSPDDRSPSLRSRARALSQAALPSLRLSPGASSITQSPLSSPIFATFTTAPAGISKAQDESQKLLAHVLDQLHRRPQCPPLDSLSSKPTPMIKPDNIRPSISRTYSSPQAPEPDSDDESERTFSPDVAFDLMNRLRDVLTISLSQQWRIFRQSSLGTQLRGMKGWTSLYHHRPSAGAGAAPASSRGDSRVPQIISLR